MHRRERDLPPWSLDPTITPRAARITAQHAFASAAIPILFRAVRLDGEFHCDGGLRQNVPLSPARRLGARGVIVVNPRFIARSRAERRARAHEDMFPGPLFLLGKTLNALLLDRIDTDLARLRSINDILEAGSARYGEGFVEEINEALGHPKGRGMRPMRSILDPRVAGHRQARRGVRALAAFREARGRRRRAPHATPRRARGTRRVRPPLVPPVRRRVRAQLIELGREDARARHDELCAFFEAMSKET